MKLTKEELQILFDCYKVTTSKNDPLYEKLVETLESNISFIQIEEESLETEFVPAFDIQETDLVVVSGIDYEILQIKRDEPKYHATQYISGLVRIRFKNLTEQKKYRYSERVEILKRK